MKLKVIFVTFISFFLMSASYADAVFMNKSKANNTDYNLEITYKFCYFNAQTMSQECGDINTAKINMGEKNYAVISTPELPANATQEYLFLLSAVAKDAKRKVIANGSYGTAEVLAYSTLDNNHVISKFGWLFNFDVIEDLGIITNEDELYQSTGPMLTVKAPSFIHAPSLPKTF